MPKAAAQLIGSVAVFVGTFIATGNPVLAFQLASVSFALGLVQLALAPDMPSFQAQAAARTQMVRQAVTTRRLPIGEVILGGALTFYESTSGNQFHHMVVTLGDAPAAAWDGIDIVWLDDTPVFAGEIDGGGNVVAGKFAGKVRINKHLGGPAQVADADLIADITRLDANFRGQGVAYLYVRVDWNRDLFPNGLPRVRGLSRTNTVLDTRDQVRRWTPNAAMTLNEYVTEPEVGLGYVAADLDDALTDAAANISDEIVAAAALGHAVAAVDVAADTLELAVAGTGAPLRLETGDRVELFVDTGGAAPGGISLAVGYFAIVERLVGAPFADAAATTIPLVAGNYTGAAATAIAAGHVDAIHGPGIRAAVKLATTYAGALARQPVTITSAGTGQPVLIKTGEPRYTASGVIDTDLTPKDIIEDLLSAMAGRFVWTGGTFRILPAAFRSPTLDLDESDLMGPLTVRTRHSRRQRFNAVKGIFATQLAVGEATDYPSVIDAGFATADGGTRIFADRDRPFTSRAATAQRLGKIELGRHRREFAVDFPTTLKGLRAVPGTVVRLSNTRRGWVNKTFEVVEQEDSFYGDGDPKVQGVTLRLIETDALIYAFDPATDETIKPPKPVPPGGSPFTVAPPTAVIVESGTAALYTRLDGTIGSRLKITWTAPADAFVTSGGRIDIRVKPSANVDWEPQQPVLGNQTLAYVLDVQDGVDYDTELTSANALGVRSDQPVTVLNHTVIGKTARPSVIPFLAAQQKGDVVNMEWGQIADLDRNGATIRFAAKGTDPATFDNWKLVTRATRGTFVTNAALPPGDWVIGIKAVDTSDNESLNAVTRNLTVTAGGNLGVFIRIEAPRWARVPDPTIAADATSAGNDGTITGATFTVGKIGTSAIATTSLSGQSVVVTDDPSLHSDSFTVEFWFRPSELRVVIVVNKAANLGWRFFINGANLLEFDKLPGDVGNLISINPPSIDVWTHVAGTFDAVSGDAKLYIDGVLNDSRTGLADMGGSAAADIEFMKGNQPGGALDDVRLWNSVRLQSEITANKDRELTGVEAGLIGYWKLNEGTFVGFLRHDVSGTLVPDSTLLASAHTNIELFEQFVPFPVATSTYEGKEIDLTFDSIDTRLFAPVTALTRSDRTGTVSERLEVDHRTAAGAYDGFEVWTVGTADIARFVKMRVVVDTASAPAWLELFSPTADIVERDDVQRGLVIAAGGTLVLFKQPFHAAFTPALNITAQTAAGAARIANPDGVRQAAGGFFDAIDELHVFDQAGVDVGGTVDIIATGA